MADLELITDDKLNVVETRQQLTLVAAEDITAGEAVRINTAGKWENADASAIGTADYYGVATRSVKAGEAVTAIRSGVVDGFDLAGLAYGAPVFLSNTDDVGALADAAGSTSRIVGRVIPANGQLIGATPDKLLDLDPTSYTIA